MTTYELIQKLKEYPGDTPVSVGSNGWGDPALVVTVPHGHPLYPNEVDVVPILKGETE